MKPSISLIALILTGCIIGCTTQAAVMQSWVGQNEAELLERWGAPDSVMTLEDGRKVYTWKRIWNDNNGVHYGRQTFTIDANGKICSWSYQNMPNLLKKW